jgi:hypothetical protein
MTPSDHKAPMHSDFPEMRGVREYVTISFTSGSRGQNVQISPKSSDTDTAVEAAKNEGLAGALNKLAECGYRLLEGTVLNQNLAAAEGTLFMYRER